MRTSAPWVAGLPWYDLGEIRPATDALWSRIRQYLERAGLDVPEELDRQTPYEDQWESGRLLLSQACGYDVLVAHRGKLRILAVPQYSAPGCIGSSYSSHVLVRADSPCTRLEELRGTRCVINTRTSHSGMNILRALVAPLHMHGRFFSSVGVSGAHEISLDDSGGFRGCCRC